MAVYGPVRILPYDPQCHEIFAIYYICYKSPCFGFNCNFFNVINIFKESLLNHFEWPCFHNFIIIKNVFLEFFFNIKTVNCRQMYYNELDFQIVPLYFFLPILEIS